MKIHQSLTLAAGLMVMPFANAAITTFSTGPGTWEVGSGIFAALPGESASSVWTYDTDAAEGSLDAIFNLAGGGTASVISFSGPTYGGATNPVSPVNAPSVGMNLGLYNDAVASQDASVDFQTAFTAAGHDINASGDVMVFNSGIPGFNVDVLLVFEENYFEGFLGGVSLPSGDTLLQDAFFLYATIEQTGAESGFARLSANLNPVPLPPAVWLLGSALGGLLLRQRRQA